MGVCSRLALAISRVFPTANFQKSVQCIESYRKRKQYRQDWEGMNASFQRIVEIAFKNRHSLQ